jgi:AraC-like DNA-binding protein
MCYFSVVEMWTLITDFVLIAGISLLGLNILFLAKSNKIFSQKIIIVFFASAIFFLLYYYSYLHRLRTLGAVAVFFGNGIGFILGPLLLFQLKSLVLPKEKFIRTLYLHLIPFMLCWLFVSVPLAISMATDYLTPFGAWYARNDYYFNLTENVYFLIYISYAMRLQRQITKATKENYSSSDKNNLDWFRHFLLGFIIIVCFDTLCTIYELFFPMIPWNIGTLIAFSFVGLYTYLGYKGMFQSNILIPDFLLQKLSIVDHNNVGTMPQPAKHIIRKLDSYSEQEIESLKTQLSDILNNKKPYLNESLSLADLADEMKISHKKLSELLNQHMNVSFYNLVNQYRVSEVIDRMKLIDYEKYTLVGIAYECGFQSKASFNRIFKQKTGYSPSSYRKESSSRTMAN